MDTAARTPAGRAAGKRVTAGPDGVSSCAVEAPEEGFDHCRRTRARFESAHPDHPVTKVK
jgi:hypothetical protein